MTTPQDDYKRALGNGHHEDKDNNRIQIGAIGVLEMVIVLSIIMCFLAVIWSPFIVNLFKP